MKRGGANGLPWYFDSYSCKQLDWSMHEEQTNAWKQNTKGSDDVLNGIAFKGDNMVITGKNWSKIYEVAVK